MKSGFYILTQLAGVVLRSNVYESPKEAEAAASHLREQFPEASVNVQSGKAQPIYVPKKS